MEIPEGNLVGNVLSREVRAHGGTKDGEILPVGLKYFADHSLGGNPITIGFRHCTFKIRGKFVMP